MKVLVVLSCLVLACMAQSRRCDPPDTWESRIEMHDHDRHVYVMGRLMYDSPNERMRRIEEVAFRTNNSTDEDYFDVIYLHRSRLEIRYNIKTKLCNVTELTRPFRPFTIPADANLRAQGYIGSSFNGVLVDRWDAKLQDEFWVGQFTTRDCLPVHDEYFSKMGNASHHFYDVTLGISDPEAFMPPPECKIPPPRRNHRLWRV